jgi:hypothetical protein
MITLMWREHSTHGWILEGEFQTVDSIIDYLQHSVNRIGEFKGDKETQFGRARVFYAAFSV